MINSNKMIKRNHKQIILREYLKKFSNILVNSENNQSLLKTYSKILLNLQIIGQTELNKNLFLITNESCNWLNQLEDFHFLKETARQLNKRIKETVILLNSNDLKPDIYFSKTLKDQLKYGVRIDKKNIKRWNSSNGPFRINASVYL